MERPVIDEGLLKWAALVATVVALEYVGEESLTSAFNRAMEHRTGRYVALGGLVVTGAHLLNLLPKEADPYYLATGFIDRRKAV